MTLTTKKIMAWGDYGSESVTGQWSSNTYDRSDATEYVPMADFQIVKNAARLGLQMARANDLWNTAEAIMTALDNTVAAIPYIRADAPELVALVAAISSAHIPNEQQREAVQVALAKWEALQ